MPHTIRASNLRRLTLLHLAIQSTKYTWFPPGNTLSLTQMASHKSCTESTHGVPRKSIESTAEKLCLARTGQERSVQARSSKLTNELRTMKKTFLTIWTPRVLPTLISQMYKLQTQAELMKFLVLHFQISYIEQEF